MENQTKTLSPLGTDLKLSPPSQLDEEYRNLPPCTPLGDCCCFHCNFTALPPCKTKRELSKFEENGKNFPFSAYFLPCFPFQSAEAQMVCQRNLSLFLKQSPSHPLLSVRLTPVTVTWNFYSANNNPIPLPSFECVGSYFFTFYPGKQKFDLFHFLCNFKQFT